MTDEEKLCLKLTALKNRWKLFLSLNQAITGFFAGLFIVLIMMISGKFFSISFSFLYIIPLFISLIFFLLESYKKFSLRDVAFSIDAKIDLKERLGTAVEMIEKKITSSMVKALIKDASNICVNLKDAEVIPFELPLRKIIIMFSLLLLFTGFYFIPIRISSDKTTPAVRTLIKEKGKEIDRVSEEIKKNSEKMELSINRELAEDLKELSRKMQSEELTKKQVLMDISSLEQKWKERINKYNDVALKETLTDREKKSTTGESPEDMLKSMAKKARKGELSDKEKSDMAEKLDEILKNMKDSAMKDELEKLSRTLKNGNNKEISQAMEEMAQKISENKDNMKQMIDYVSSKLQACQKDIAGEGGQKDLSDMAGTGEFKEGTFKDGFSQNPTEIPVKKISSSDNVRSDYGEGSTNEEKKGNPVKEQPFYERKSDASSDKTDTFVRNYEEERLETNKKETLLSGKTGNGKTAGSDPVRGAPSGEGTSSKTYKETYEEYKYEAEKSLNKEKIPKGYKAIVRQYFDTIKPANMVESDTVKSE